MGGQLVFFNVTVRATLPLNYYSLLYFIVVAIVQLYAFYCLSYSWLGSGKGRIEYILGGREVLGERFCGGLLGHMQKINKSEREKQDLGHISTVEFLLRFALLFTQH